MEIRRDFMFSYAAVLSSCREIAVHRRGPGARQLAVLYLTHTLRRQTSALWWIDSRAYLTETWFILQYARRHALLPYDPPRHTRRTARAALNEALLSPEKLLHPGAVELRLMESDSGHPLIAMSYEENVAFSRAAHELHMTWDALLQAYVRRIDETCMPASDRCAEAGASLLSAGFRLIVMDGELRRKIAQGDYRPEHKRWILASAQPRKLEICFPQNKLLYQRARSLGAKWNGRAIELNVWHADALMDFARLYDFRLTRDAQERIEDWCAASEEIRAIIPPVTPAAPEEEPDPLEAILCRHPHVPEDLIDED